MTTLDALADRLRAELGGDRIVNDRQELRTYECDGLAHYKVVPGLVVLPRDAAECARTVRACVAAGVPFVARGSGTGLSGGALPHADGVLIVTSKMRSIIEIAPDDERAVVEPGVVNLHVTRPPPRTATTTPRTRPASRSARSAATWPRTPAAPTASSTASPPTT